MVPTNLLFSFSFTFSFACGEDAVELLSHQVEGQVQLQATLERACGLPKQFWLGADSQTPQGASRAPLGGRL